MCLIVVAHNVFHNNDKHPHLKQYKTIVASNRDEFYHRSTKHLHLWHDVPILAGRDEERGGTWLGIDQRDPERWAAVTNYRGKKITTSTTNNDNNNRKEEVAEVENANLPSRGNIVVNYLNYNNNSKNQTTNSMTAVHYIASLRSQEYNGFNLLLGDSTGIYYYGNRDCKNARQRCYSTPLPPGIYGLCNDVLDTNWPKLIRCKTKLQELLLSSSNSESENNGIHHHSLLPIMNDSQRPKDEDLPSTGLSLTYERLLSAIYIDGHKDYGTRSTTTLLIKDDGQSGSSILEKNWPSGEEYLYEFDKQKGGWLMIPKQPTHP